MKPAPFAAVLAAVLLAVVALPSAGTRVPSPAAIGPPGVETVQLAWVRQASPNAAGLYFDLLVAANVTGRGAGQVWVVASLRAANTTVFIARNATWAPFNGSAGPATVIVDLPGPLIRLAGLDGPYSLYLFAEGWSSDGNTAGGSVTTSAMTPAFAAFSFAPLWADVLGPITYSTPDADHDGLTDALVAHVPVVVRTAGPVDIWGALSPTNSDGYNGYDIPTTDETRFLTPGTYTWDLVFPGYQIRQSGWDGPYLLSVLLRFPFLDPGNLAPTLTRTFPTPAYTSSGFGPSAVILRAPITADLEPSGLTADALEVLHVPLHVQAAGNYTVQAVPYTPCLESFLRAPYPTTQAVRDLSLPAGDTSVDLTFSSLVLQRWPAGQNATFLVSANPIGALREPACSPGPYLGDGFIALWTEKNVTASLLPSHPVAWVNVTATYEGQPCTFLTGEAAQLSDHFDYQGRTAGTLGSPATLDLELYPGTFELLLNGCGMSSVQTLTVPGTETLDYAFPTPPSLPPDRYTITFPAWNDSVTDFVGSRLGGSGARFSADLAGNWDGTASTTELALYLQTLVWPFFPMLLTVDGSEYSNPTWTFTGVQGAGPVNSTAPVTTSVRFEERMPVATNPGGNHTLTLGMCYVTYGVPPYQVDLQLPLGVEGSLNVSGIASAWSTTPAPANVSVQTLGAGSWRLTPGAPPPGYSVSRAVVTVTAEGRTTAGLETFALPIALFLAAGLVALVAACVELRRPPSPRR